VALVILSGFPTQVFANQDNSCGCTSLERVSDGHNIEENFLNEADLETMTSIIEEKINNGYIVVNSLISLDWTDVRGVELKFEGTTTLIIVIPIVGEGYNNLSNLTLNFTDDSELLHYQELTLSNSTENTFEVTTYINGELTYHRITDIEFFTDGLINDNYVQVDPFSVGAVAACIAFILAVDIAIAYLIAGTCSFACSIGIVVPVVCATCISGIVVLAGANIMGGNIAK